MLKDFSAGQLRIMLRYHFLSDGLEKEEMSIEEKNGNFAEVVNDQVKIFQVSDEVITSNLNEPT